MKKGRTCDWFDREGALRIERGEEPDPHLDQCRACQDAHDQYLGLVELLPRAHGGDRRVARRIRLAISGVLGGVFCFFTGRSAAFAASGVSAVPPVTLLLRWTALGIVSGLSGSWMCAPALDRAEQPAQVIDLPPQIIHASVPPQVSTASVSLPAPAPAAPKARSIRARIEPSAADEVVPAVHHPPNGCGDDCVLSMMLRGLCGGECPARAARE